MLALETLVDITDSMVQWQRECAEGKLDKPEATVRPKPLLGARLASSH